ncbi:MAG TPA: FAD-dependent oxidoreductase [Ensifer sp.]|nr:FAD-dependent oxidoreductase [Ensifer sp.]
MTRVVIVGGGQGGFQLAASLRQEGHSGPIVLVSQEPDLPYQRPPLSKAYLKDGRAEGIELRPRSFFERNEIDVIAGETVVAIDRPRQTVLTQSGIAIAYDHLVIATGARNVTPPIPGLSGGNVFALRTAADADALRLALAAARRRPIVIGGGFIGLEFAAVAASSGHSVTVVEATERLMARAVSPAMSAYFRGFHEAMGVAWRLGDPVEEILRAADGSVSGARLRSGEIIAGDMILVAVGVRPNVELAESAGLRVSNGIVVDAQLLTDDPAISSLGDCAAFPDPITGVMTRLESVQAATDHARTIARRLTGKAEPYSALPWFWSDQGAWKLQIAGLAGDGDDQLAVEAGEGRKLVFRFAEGRLRALETLNAAAEHMAARHLLKSPGGVTMDELAEMRYDIVALAKSRKARAA